MKSKVYCRLRKILLFLDSKVSPFRRVIYKKKFTPQYFFKDYDSKRKEVALHYNNVNECKKNRKIDATEYNKDCSEACLPRIKIRIVHSALTTWNAIASIVKAFNHDPKYDTKIILTDIYSDHSVLVQQMLDEKVSFFDCIENSYDVAIDKPDILIVTNPYDGMNLGKIKGNVKLVVAATMSLIRYNETIEDFWKIMDGKVGLGRFNPDYYLLDSLLYNDIRETKFFSKKIVEMGNAKYDSIYDCVQNRKSYINSEWRKLDNKKVILWATSHGITNGRLSNYVTFDLYAKTIFEILENNSQIGLIFRPHPNFIYELLRDKLWSEEDYKKIREHFEDSPNLIWDDSNTYEGAFAYCDCILTDAYCGITASALPMMKPIAALYRNAKVKSLYKEIDDCLYSIRTKDDLKDFIEMMVRGEDAMYEVREKVVKKVVKNFDGQNGARIKKFIEEKYYNC